MNSTLKLHQWILHFSLVLACTLMVGQVVKADTPQLNGISPAKVAAGTTNLTVTLDGGSFAAENQVFVNDAEITPQSISGNSISMLIPDNLLVNPGTVRFEVRTTDNFVSSTRVLVVYDPAKLNPQAATFVPSASYRGNVSPGSLASAFGTHLATASAGASSLPLPTSLSGTSMFVNGQPMSLLYVSDDTGGFGQINFVIPDELGTGAADVVILASDGTATLGTMNVDPVSPGVYSINQNGSGIAVGLTTTDGQSYTRIWNDDLTPADVSAGTDQQPNYLVLFGTGWRYRTDISNVSVTINGTPATVFYAGLQPDYAGLDQINVTIPPTLAGINQVVEIVVTVDNHEANRTTIKIQ